MAEQLVRGGDTPHVLHGVQKDYRRLYYSDHLAALRFPVTLQAGYGIVEAGQALAKNLSAAGNKGKLLPYCPTTFPASIDPGRAYLVADSGSSATELYVTLDDSYKFAVGDDVVINDGSNSAENLGAITAIDRTTDPHRAKITVTTATGNDFTAAQRAYIIVEAGTSGNNYSDCIGILEKTVDTGTGQYAKGANATLIWGNCVLYSGVLINMDSAAQTDVSATLFGQYLAIR